MKKLFILSFLTLTQLHAHCLDSRISSILAIDESLVTLEESNRLGGLLEDLVLIKNTVEKGENCVEQSADQMISMIDQRNPDAPNSIMGDRLYSTYLEFVDAL